MSQLASGSHSSLPNQWAVASPFSGFPMARASAYYCIGSATATPFSSSSFFRHRKLPAYDHRSSPSLHVSANTTIPLTMSNHPTPHPSLEVVGGARDSFLPAFRTLHAPYHPYPLIAWNRHLETIFASLFRSRPDVRYRRECLRTKDDGAVALDWVSGDRTRLPANAPVLILLPGLTGGSQDSYVRHMLVRARSKGWRVVVFNGRGCANSPVTTPQFYSASFLGDMSEVVALVKNRYPNANLYAVGWSVGANILVRYLGQESCSCILSGAVSLCNPFNLVNADEDLRKGFNIVYDKSLASGLHKIFNKHAPLFEEMDGEFNISVAANAKSVREFDEALTRVSFEFKSVDDYYSNSGSSESIKNVCIPLLCIQAANDPIAASRDIPREDIEANSNCLLIVTPKGGHLGWVAGAEAPTGAPWTDPLVMDFLEHLEQASSSSVRSGGLQNRLQPVEV